MASTPAIKFTFSIDGEQTFSVGFPRFQAQLTDLREFWIRYASPKLYRDIEGNFDNEGKDAGGWEPLSKPYAAWKAKHYPGRKMLVRTGAMKQSLTFDGEKPGPEGLFEASRNALVFGTRIKYAQYHQRGEGKRHRRILFFLGGESKARETFGRLLHLYAADMAKRSGLRTRAAIRAGVAP